MEYSTQKAEAFIQANTGSVNPLFRPHLHMAAPIGWINDPNGFSYYQGQYHMFCQYYPYQAIWGPMHWGHWTSPNLMSWTWQGVALAPDSPFDNLGCFSGTVLVKDETMYLMYTGVHKNSQGIMVQEQCLATSKDGLTFEKHPVNPVITSAHLPAGSDMVDFRDPKLMPHGEGYRVLLASRGEHSGLLLSYLSQDMVRWSYEGVFADGISLMPECPDYFHLDGKDIVVTCLMNQPPEGLKYQNDHHAVVYILGDEKDGRFIPQEHHSFDLGLDYYSPQTLLTPDGRHVMIGWMQMWGEAPPTHYLKHNWQGLYTFPRQLSLRDGKLCQQPIEEIAALYEREVTMRNQQVQGALSLPGVEGRPSRLQVELTNMKQGKADIHLMQQGEMYVLLRYDGASGVLSLDRSRLYYPVLALPGQEAHDMAAVQLEKGLSSLRLDILLDTCSIEVFAQDGAAALTSLAFPKEGSADIRFAGEYSVKDLKFHTLKRVAE